LTDFWYGKGATAGSCFPRLLLPDSRLLLFALWTYGSIEMQFQHMRIAPFGDEQKRMELIGRLNSIPGISFPTDAHKRRPSFDMAILAGEPERSQFLDAMAWALAEVQAHRSATPLKDANENS
jgi:hypothetical protein